MFIITTHSKFLCYFLSVCYFGKNCIFNFTYDGSLWPYSTSVNSITFSELSLTKKHTQWKRTIMHTEVLLCRQITAVLQVKIVVPVRGGPHQEAEPGGRQEVTHSHCHPPCSWTDRERTRENTKQKNPLGYKLHWTKQTANVHKHHCI